jgi:tetratricopeptide (TPR) repeat protein
MTGFAEQGHAAFQRNDLASAAQWFEKAVKQNPQDAGSWAWFGQCLCSLGRRADGIAALRQSGKYFMASAREIVKIHLLLELIVELQHWSDFEGARELGEAAIQIEGSNVQAFQLLALTYAQLNHLPEALEAGHRALELAPDNIAMRVLQASLEADAGNYSAARDRLQMLLNEPLETRQAFRAQKEMARVVDRLGQSEQVFKHLYKAAALSESLPEYAEHNLLAIPAIIESNRSGFDRELMGRWAGEAFSRERAPPVFLIGFMRSGTTLTQEVLDTHPDVFVSDEADFVSATLRHLHQLHPGRIGTADKLRKLARRDIQELRDFYWSRVEKRFGSRLTESVFVDKFTMNTVDAGFINCIFPDAKIVFVQRDPRDVCLSCFMQLMVPSPTTVQLLQWENTAQFYAQVMGWWLHIRQQLTVPVIEFRYEDAVASFEPVFRGIFQSLGLGWDPAVVRFHTRVVGKFIASPSRSQVAKPLYASSVARWRRFEAEFVPVSGLLRPYVQAFGYEPF